MKKRNNKLNSIIQILVFILIFTSITFFSSRITGYVTNDNPEVCKEMKMKITNATIDKDDNYLLVEILNHGNTNINGFNVKTTSENKNIKQKVFSTINRNTKSILKLDYNKNENGALKNIILSPIVIEERNVNYCTDIIIFKI